MGDQAVAKGRYELIAGVMRTDDPLAHGQGFHGGGGHHITRARVDKHLHQEQSGYAIRFLIVPGGRAVHYICETHMLSAPLAAEVRACNLR